MCKLVIVCLLCIITKELMPKSVDMVVIYSQKKFNLKFVVPPQNQGLLCIYCHVSCKIMLHKSLLQFFLSCASIPSFSCAASVSARSSKGC